MIGAVPGDAAVSATNTLGAHLSERRRIFSFPVLREARWVAVDLKRPSYLDDATGKKFAAAYARLRQDSRWRVVRAEDGVDRPPQGRRRDSAAAPQIGIVWGSRYAQSASTATVATASSSAAATGTAHARYQTAR